MMLSTASKIVTKRTYNCYLDVKIASQKIHTVVNYKSPDEPSPCLLRTPEKRLLDWVKKPRPSGLTWGREFLTEELLCQFLAWLRMSEWAQLRGCEREREGGEGGEVWRGGWGEHTHTHTHTSLHYHCNENNGQISLKGHWFDTGHDPHKQTLVVPFTLQWFVNIFNHKLFKAKWWNLDFLHVEW